MRNNFNPWLLAASVVVAGAATLGAFNTPANAITSVEELTDVNSSSWAYEALTDLVEKYDVLEGYPNKTYKGKQFTTRYEMAAALDALIKAVGRDLARLGAEKANKADLETLAALQEEFKTELAAHRARLDALESRATSIEEKNAEQDDRLDLLEKTQIHGDFSIGALHDWTANGAGTGGGLFGGGARRDALSTIGRVRVGINVPVYEGTEDGKMGDGNVVARLVAGWGRNISDGGQISGYSQLAAGQDFVGGLANGVGIGSGASNNFFVSSLSTRLNTYVDLAYYKQHFKAGIPILTDLTPGDNNEDGLHDLTADMYTGILGWRYHFAKSPYRGDELNQFQNMSLVTNPGMLLAQLQAPGVVMDWHKGLGEHNSLDVTAGVFAPNKGNAFSLLGVTEQLAWNYDTHWFGDKYTKPGTLYAGAYHALTTLGNAGSLGSPGVNQAGVALPAVGDSSLTGIYAGWNQELYRGMGLSADYAYNMGNVGINAGLAKFANAGGGLNSTGIGVLGGVAVPIRQAATAVLTVPLTVFDKDLTKRARDVFGVGYAWIKPQRFAGDGGNVLYDSAAEHVVEGFYRFALTDNISVIPSVQVIFNRLGDGNNDITTAAGLRASYVF